MDAAAYRSGEALGGDGAEIIHDYTRKKGVVHKEILLPDNAPEEYQDRQTLWRAVEARERRHDARLAREIEVALQKEFDLQENIALLREYIKENFVDKGMIADFAVHYARSENPHAHIMLTTRHVTPDGFKGKNRDWDKDAELLRWRENREEINNRKFAEKGLAERIDHRTLKAQGIDREPTIHLGHKAAALERKGIRTAKGDYNREIQQRNLERAAERAASGVRNQTTDFTQHHAANLNSPAVGAASGVRNQTTDFTQHHAANEERKQNEKSADETAQTLNELRDYYITLEKDLSALIPKRNEIRQELPRLTFRAENIDEHTKNIEILQGKIAELQEERQNLNFLQRAKKQETDQAIKHAQQELKRAEIFFVNRFGVTPNQAPNEIKRIDEKIRTKQADLTAKNTAILDIMNNQDKILLEYHTQKLIAQTRPDGQQIEKILEKLNKPPDNTHARLLQERIDRRLNIIPDQDFQRIIEKLPQHQAQTLIQQRKHAEEKALSELEKLRKQTKTRDLTHSR
ncbi:MAG: MobA/MobL family protein [Candidatus Bathyarchaeota archaeon]|uniref:MobQ family relaxase n=1 Tax=Candidatus Bathycorpusculum sp. TaxID=2994959 RepID=UPI00282F331C|nr:MobA/MobL family protein [Candidatus Termiticorpusculum sp.]MCL2292355.1 MobA/MobL family protein [Candidatus Termiticorpusculum sp.]